MPWCGTILTSEIPAASSIRCAARAPVRPVETGTFEYLLNADFVRKLAQSESANDAPFARYWMLVGSLTVDGIKMSKSVGNFITIHDALRDNRPEVIRYFMQSVHYSNPVDYSDDAMAAAARGWERIWNAVRLTRRAMNTATNGDDGHSFKARLDEARAGFKAAMDGDFSTPQALAVLQGIAQTQGTSPVKTASPSQQGIEQTISYSRLRPALILPQSTTRTVPQGAVQAVLPFQQRDGANQTAGAGQMAPR